MTRISIGPFVSTSAETMPSEMVVTTSPPASRAPAVSKKAAISRAAPMVSALAPTAGPTLFVTSLAPMFMAM